MAYLSSSLGKTLPQALSASDTKILTQYLPAEHALEISKESESEQQKKALAAFLLLSLHEQIAILGTLGATYPALSQKLKSHITKPRISLQQYEERQQSPSLSQNTSPRNTSGKVSSPSGNNGMELGKNTPDELRQGFEKNGVFDAFGKNRGAAVAAAKKSQKPKVSWTSSSPSNWWVAAGGIFGTFAAGAAFS